MRDQPDRPLGQRFSFLYTERSANITDSKALRLRLHGELAEILVAAGSPAQEAENLSRYLSKELGARIRQPSEDLFEAVSIKTILDIITLVFRFYASHRSDVRAASAPRWRDEVRRIFREEQAGYDLDDHGGVHLRVDAAFQFARTLAIEALRGPRYEVADQMFQRAYDLLDGGLPRPREAIKNAFDAAEALFKLLSTAPRLGRKEVNEVLRPILDKRYAQNVTSKLAAAKMIEGFCDWIDAVHFYRHAPPEGVPQEPPEEVWHLLMSQAAAYVRWLAELDGAAQRKP